MLTDSPKPSSKHDCNKSEQNTSFTIDKICEGIAEWKKK